MSLIFDIKRYAINDGPGIRLTIFFKGCPLSCIWCHNPEGLTRSRQKMYTKKKCIGCQSCVEICPVHALRLTENGIVSDDTLCTLCGECAEACPAKAIEMSGINYTTDELMNEIKKEIIFFDQSGGGVTFCGGEPLMHGEMLIELLQKCGELGIHRVIDTTLFARPELVMQVASMSELFLVDLKQMDSEKHKKYTGVPNELILSNIEMAAKNGIDFFIRIPLIEGVNADVENITRSAQFLASIPWKRKHVNLLPYHDIARNKHEKLGSVFSNEGMLEPSKEVINRTIAIFDEYGILATPGG